jgi:hypothetical protein
MIRKRTFGTVAAIGGLTAAIAMLTGLPSARADEVSDLRANQELLQRRIDQLAQSGNAGAGSVFSVTPNPAAGQPAGAGSFPRSFLIPGTDTSIRIGGEVREVLDYWFTGGPANNSPQTTTVGITGQLESIPLDRHGQVVFPGTAPLGPATAGSIIDRSRSNGIFSQSPRESKLIFETRTPTAYGEARTYIEFDFAGSTQFAPGGAALGTSDSLVPRLRFAYGTLGGFLAGQANSNFADPDANGEALDFGGNPGEPGHTRIPQIRYTQPLAQWGLPGAVSVSAETPEAQVLTPAGRIASDSSSSTLPTGQGLLGALGGVCNGSATVAGTACSATSPVLAGNPTKAPAPNLTAAWYIPQPWGHMDFSAVMRPDIELNDGRYVSRQFIGYGAHVGADVKPGWFGWVKDDIIFHAVIGDGIGTYLNASNAVELATNYLGNGQILPGGPLASTATTTGTVPTQLAAAGNILTKTVRRLGGEIGYQHWWLDNLRQNVSMGWEHSDIPAFVGVAQQSAANKDLTVARTNLIWNPVAFVDVGVEYVWGHRVTMNNLRGDEHVLISKFAFKF